MRIIHIQKVKGIAGSENHLLALLPGLQAMGIDVTMLVLATDRVRAQGFIEAMQARGVESMLQAMGGDLSPNLPFQLSRLLQQQHYDLVHTHLIHADFYGGIAAKWAGVKALVATRHNTFPPLARFPLNIINRLVSKNLDRIICISHNVAKFTAGIDSNSQNKLEVIHYGLDPVVEALGESRPTFRKQANEVIIGIVARLIVEKDYPTLIRAMRQVVDKHAYARLVIIGDGPLRSELQHLVHSLDLQQHIDFLGQQDYAARLMPGFDIFAFPSLFEGFGLVLLEAMAAGLPVIATRVASIPEIVEDGVSGLLVPPQDPDRFAAAINTLIADPALAHRMGQAGQTRVADNFTVEAMVQHTAQLYRAVLGHDS